MKVEKYDSKWLVNLALEQIPEENEVINNLRNIKEAYVSRAYIYFINPLEQDEHVDVTIPLSHVKMGEIILDILKDKRVSGIEIMKYVK